MRANEGTVDRILRLVIGIVLVSLVFVGPQTPLGWIGILPIVTGLAGYCPMYRVIGVNTAKRTASPAKTAGT